MSPSLSFLDSLHDGKKRERYGAFDLDQERERERDCSFDLDQEEQIEREKGKDGAEMWDE